MRFFYTAILLFIYIAATFCQSPKREMRGAWLTTVTNIDFPSNRNLTTKAQKAEICQILDSYSKSGINAVFFQVRPAADAFYYSEIEPWSKYLTGEQGKAPNPFYDPLDFIIKEAHKRNMELHAWINPFRIKTQAADTLTSDHPYSKNPSWGWDYNEKTYFDPGIPEVREYAQKIVFDIVKRYDIDGIHFDDYFYPYKNKEKVELPDQRIFRVYGNEFYPNNIEDWRRNNINIFIEELSSAIKAEKKWVKFGISPFGIWKDDIDLGDNINRKGYTSSYDILYADIIKWLEKGWIDYCAPQLYWAIGYKPADYTKLLKWWDNHTFGRNMYVGHSLYKVNPNSNEEAWRSSLEIERQIEALRKADNIKGSIFYSSVHLTKRKELEPLRDALENNFYKNYSLLPLMPWIDDKAPSHPRNVKIENSINGNLITWTAPRYKDEMNKAYKYIIYKVNDPKSENTLIAENIVYITDKTSYNIPLNTKDGYFIITAIDRMHNESKGVTIKIIQDKLTSLVFIKGTEPPMTRIEI